MVHSLSHVSDIDLLRNFLELLVQCLKNIFKKLSWN